MTDIWPCRGPWRINYATAYSAVFNAVGNAHIADVMAAIAGADGGFDLAVINDTPGTGDYSVGTWQINYYNGLYGERSRLFGTPCQLIHGGILPQTAAALHIYQQQGFNAWGAYTNGSYKQFLHGAIGAGAGATVGAALGMVPPPPGPGRDDYSPTIHHSATQVRAAAVDAMRFGIGMYHVRTGR